MDGHTYTANFEAPEGEPILAAYPDSLGIPTIGLGHTGPEVHLGLSWTREQCMATYNNDYAIAAGHAPHILGVSTFGPLSEARKAVIVDLCFNPGPTRLAGFVRMLSAIRNSDWERAHDELLDSIYAKQVKTRATTNANVLLTGNWPEEITIAPLGDEV